MHYFKKRRSKILGALLCYFLVTFLVVQVTNNVVLGRDTTYSFNKSTTSSSIAISADNTLVWSVNPDNDSVSVIRTDTNELVADIKVGDEPQSIALDPQNRYAYVANAAGNGVTAITILNAEPNRFASTVEGNIITGAEPFNLVASPDGNRVFVANSNQDTITVINPKDHKIIGNVDLRNSLCNVGDTNRHFQPRGLSVTQDNQYLYVTRFLSFTKTDGVQGNDNGKEGVVCRLSIKTSSPSITDYVPTAVIQLASSDTGFPDINGKPTNAFPNQLQSIVIRDGHAYLPNIAASPSGPLRFDNDTQAFVNRIDGIGGNEIDRGSLNLHLGGRQPEAGKKELYFANPWAIAFTNESGPGTAYAVSAGSDLLVKLNVDSSGALSFTTDDNTTRYIDLNDPTNPATSGYNAGKNPRSIVINNDGTTAYVVNYVSRNISVVDLTTDTVTKVIQTTKLPKPGSYKEIVQVGAEIIFSSRGNFVPPHGTTGSTEDRLSYKGRQNCASCHNLGLTDGIIWQFNSGPRKSIPTNGTINPRAKFDQRIMNYSAIFDEIQDSELNTRNVSSPGPLSQPQVCSAPPPDTSTFNPDYGMLIGDNGNISTPPCVVNMFTKPNANRAQVQIQLPGSSFPINTLDAMTEWVRSGIRTPNGPLTNDELTAAGGDATGGIPSADIMIGRKLFIDANCQSCHSGGKWSNSTKDFISPPNQAEIATEAGATNANQSEFLFRFLRDIKSFNLNVPGSGNAIPQQPKIGAIEKDTNNLDALGFDYNGDGKGSGFNIPSLLGIYSVQPYYHNGACETLDCVLADVNHRTSGLKPGQEDPLVSKDSRTKLVHYLETIDAKTPPLSQ